MPQRKNFLKNYKNYIPISFALIFTEFYYFDWGSRALISNNYLLLNTFFLLIFSILFFTTLIKILFKINNNISFRYTKIFYIIFFCFIYFKIIQIPFFLANIIEFKSLLAMIMHDVLSERFFFLIPFLKIVLPFFSILILIYFIIDRFHEIMINFCISFSLVFFILMLVDVSKRINHLDINSFEKKITNNNKQVIWFILDEYDPEYISEINHGIKLPEVKNLINKAFVHNNSFSPSSSTLHSVTSILMKSNTIGSLIEDHQFFILNDKKRKIPFRLENTLFSKIDDMNLNFNILTEVIPYCSMLKMKTNCHQYTNRKLFYFDGIINLFIPIGYFAKFLDLIKDKSKFEIKKINNFSNFQNKDLFLSKKLNINFLDFDKIINNKDNLIFFHLFIPHTKTVNSSYIKKKFENIYPRNDDEEYFLNLKFTDIVIKNILEKINLNKNNEILLILSSDHWRRSRSVSIPQPSLLIMKIKKDETKVEFNNENSNIHIYDVILKFLKNEINTHEDIKLIFENSSNFKKRDIYIWKD